MLDTVKNIGLMDLDTEEEIEDYEIHKRYFKDRVSN